MSLTRQGRARFTVVRLATPAGANPNKKRVAVMATPKITIYFNFFKVIF